jgi:transposase
VAGKAGSERERIRHVPGAQAGWVVKEKKSLTASEQDPEARAAWWQAVTLLESDQPVFIDEAGTHTSMTRTYARAPKGQRAYGSVPRNRGGNLTLLAALSSNRFQAEWLIEGSVDGDVFVTWLGHVLLPTLIPGQIVVMDNLRAHYRKEVSALIEAHCCTLLYLPPYSPDFSPIELAFSKIKGQLKSLAARSKQTLTAAVPQACRTINSADVVGWFRHCGYNLQ